MLIIIDFIHWFHDIVISLAEKDILAENALAYAKELEELREFTKYEKEFRDASILEHHEVGSIQFLRIIILVNWLNLNYAVGRLSHALSGNLSCIMSC